MSKEIQEEELQDNSTEKVVPKEETLEQKIQEEKDKYLRLFAEFDNYKKRTSKERIDIFKRANQEVMIALLPILDDFDRALVEIKKNKENELSKGVELIYNKLKETLHGKGLKKMDVNIGDAFDTDKHEAITQVPAPQEDLKNTIIDITEAGYTLNETTIRYAKVIVGS